MDALTDCRHIEQAYAEFSRVVSEGGTPLQRMVGYQGGNELADLLWFEDLKLWVLLQSERINKRYWCAFGVDDPQPASMLRCRSSTPRA